MCSDCVPPSTAASAWTVTRTRLTSGCWAVSCDTGGLGVEAQHLRLRVLGPELVAHDLRPDPAGGAELRDLLQEGGARDEEEREARREVVDGQAGRDRGAHVLDAVSEGERDLLHGRGSGLGHVVAGDRDGVPLRDLGAAVAEGVGDQPQRRLRRVDVGAARDVLLEDVVLNRAVEPCPDALLLGDDLVHQQQDRGGRVDRHRRRHLVERDARRTGSACPRSSRSRRRPCRPRRANGCVGVVAHLGRQVERDRQSGRARRDQLVVAPVRLDRGAEAGVLPHRPGPARVHRRVDAPGERELARARRVARGVEPSQASGP